MAPGGDLCQCLVPAGSTLRNVYHTHPQVPNDYGSEDMDVIVKHFGTPKTGAEGMTARKIDGQAAMTEWAVFRTRLQRARDGAPKKGQEGYETRLEDAYEKIFLEEAFPNLLIVAAIFMVLCLSSVW